MVKPTEQGRETSFVELIQFLYWLEDKYGAIAELHISRDEDDTLDALLCITCVGVCKVHRDPPHNTFASCKVPYSQLHRVPEFFLDLCYEISDRIEGQCPDCLALVAALN